MSAIAFDMKYISAMIGNAVVGNELVSASDLHHLRISP
jgi:hypothetical protein